MSFNRLTEEQLETLRAIGNAGMEHAATALTQLVGENIRLQVPRVTVSELVPELLGGSERVVAGITLQVLGDIRGSILLVFPRESAQRLLTTLLGHAEKGIVIDELGSSTLKEVGNILASAYLSALGNLLHLTLIPSVPHLAFDTAGAVIDYLNLHLRRSDNSALLVETEFLGSGAQPEKVAGHFFLLPEAPSLQQILESANRS